MSDKPLVSRDEWTKARLQLLAEEKAMSKALDALARKRRELPWVSIDKSYQFAGPDGTESLADLFSGHRQLLVYHFMYGPEWKQGCPSCSFWADNFNQDFNVSFKAEEIETGEVQYNFTMTKFPVTEAPGLSAFVRTDDGGIAHSYSCHARGLDIFNGAYQMLDMTPMGRDEDDLTHKMAWVRRHDQYGE